MKLQRFPKLRYTYELEKLIKLKVILNEKIINWGPIVGDQMSGDHMHLGPNVSNPKLPQNPILFDKSFLGICKLCIHN